MATVVSRDAAHALLDQPGSAPRDLPPIIRGDSLFDDTRFTWPEPPGDDKREAKLSHFSFRDHHEARAFIWWFAAPNVVGVLGLLNLVLGNNKVLGFLGLLAGIVTNVVYLRMWVRLCKRAHPVVRKLHWYTGGPLNIVSWQALSQASAVVRDR